MAFILMFQNKLERLIGYMGGMFLPQLTENVTHLVTENIFTQKYEVGLCEFRDGDGRWVKLTVNYISMFPDCNNKKHKGYAPRMGNGRVALEPSGERARHRRKVQAARATTIL